MNKEIKIKVTENEIDEIIRELYKTENYGLAGKLAVRVFAEKEKLARKVTI